MSHTVVLLMNLGTPEAPTPRAVRRYLSEFLSDQRVVDLPRLLWLPLLHGVILNTRPRRSAAKYAKIWLSGRGSPLMVHTAGLATGLQSQLSGGTQQAGGAAIRVDYAMRYGSPSLADKMQTLREANATRLLLVPLYPQFSSSTTASCLDALCSYLKATLNPPELRILRDYHAQPAYIAALASSVRAHWQAHGEPGEQGRLLISFHGLPKHLCERGDPYHEECQTTAKLLASELGLEGSQYSVAFQSRFGPAKWLEPATSDTLTAWGRQRLARVDVICPGFAADCLETLEEIDIEARESFLSHGGGHFCYIPALNDSPQWQRALAEIITPHLHGWT